jgi:hypothetical protein
MTQTITTFGTNSIKIGRRMTATLVAGSGAVVRIIGPGNVVTAESGPITQTTSYGPYDNEMVIQVSCFAGSTIRLSDAAFTEQSAGAAVPEDGKGLRSLLPARLFLPQRTMASPPTVSVSTSGSTISGGRVYPVWTTGNASFPYLGASVLTCATPVASAQVLNPVTTNAAGTTFTQQSTKYLVDFDGTEIEFATPGGGGRYFLKVNDEYIDPAGTTVAADAVVRHVKLTFAARTVARIEFYGYSSPCTFIICDATAGIAPAAVRGPDRVIVLGDSFAGAGIGYPRTISDCLNWDDVWTSALGGTGVIAAASVRNFEQRFDRDVVSYAPAVCWIVGSVNDAGQPPADIAAALLRMRAAYLAARPDGIFIWSPNASNGPSTWTVNQNRIRWAVRDAFAGLPNTFYVDPLESRVFTRDALPSGTVRANVAAGATSMQLFGQQIIGGFPQPGSTIVINDETFEVRDSTFGGAVSGYYWYTVNIDGTAAVAHAAGSVWTTVGSSYITGSGSAGTPSGYGSSDAYRISSADIHPTLAGQVAFGRALTSELFAVANAA